MDMEKSVVIVGDGGMWGLSGNEKKYNNNISLKKEKLPNSLSK